MSILVLGACSSVKERQATDEEMKNWESTISKAVVESAYITDEYGNEDPIYYLRKTEICQRKIIISYQL